MLKKSEVIEMKCPYCNNNETKVLDSRKAEDGLATRRRRECEVCEKRFTTYEKIEQINYMVAKRDGRREAFDRNKIFNGIMKSCEKRRVSVEEIEKAVDRIEQNVNNIMEKEIDVTLLGEMVMEELKAIDEVAYVRFASVYRQFTDIDTFIKEIEKLRNTK